MTGVLCLIVLSFGGGAIAADAKRGEYLAAAAGCAGCHTVAAKTAVTYAGGRALKTPFGTFYGPNITPDKIAGIGNWSEADFLRAMRHGERPDGKNYFPAFPYPSFTKITNSEYQTLNSVSKRTATNDLTDLVSQSILRKIGTSGSNIWYEVVGQ